MFLLKKSGFKLCIKLCMLVFIAALSLQFKLTLKPLVEVKEKKFNDDTEMVKDYWDLIDEKVESPKKEMPDVTVVKSWFHNGYTGDGFSYVYGGKTATKIQKGTSKQHSDIFAGYLDNGEYSGVTISMGVNKTFDCDALRNEKVGGLAFWAKAARPDIVVYAGILDYVDGVKTQSKVALRDFAKLDTSWTFFMIPLKKFSANGKYWDENKRSEILKKVDWKKINEVRFSVSQRENGSNIKEPVKLYFQDICIIDDIPGYFDSDRYWKTFTSNEPDRMLHDFETQLDQKWEIGNGPASKVAFEFKAAPENTISKNNLAITYQLNDWCDVFYDYGKNAVSPDKYNWTKHWGLKLNIYSTRPYQSINIQVGDSGNELYIASCGGTEGWNEIIVPFNEFEKFPYYQPPNAIHNGKFDLDSIKSIDIKPAGEGTRGTFYVDNISLTNLRTIQQSNSVTEKSVTVNGSFTQIITKKINDGIFGINSAHWDADMLLPSTYPLVNAVNHGVMRIPGGLSADEYHWQDMLNKKDVNVDIDEYLDFAEKTGCEPMITVNFGSGTPEEAAAWVDYVNIRKQKKVKFWEIGNELYGSWHKYHCTAEQYGKKAVEFITAMKKVDPSILITVVWELDGTWNKTVFDYVKDIADGVNVHNYPQESGEENDIALLASPQTLDDIVARLNVQLKEYGAKGKNYQIWLTEWNSVDFNPTPQSLSIVNGLFVADYLSMLTKHNIEQASYWNVHNSLFEQGGDYGYLSRSDAPEGVNVPRPSYWAFKLASESLRGSLVQCSSDDKKVTAYAAKKDDGSKTLLIINKHAATSCNLTLAIPGFNGKAMVSQLTKDTPLTGYESKSIDLKSSGIITVPAHSITKITIK